MEFTIDQILLMQDTIMDVRRRTQELTTSEIVSRESRDRSSAIYSSAHNGTISPDGLMVNCHVSYAVNN